MKKFSLFFAILFVAFSVKAQVVDSMLNVYAEQMPFEKVHLHIDKDVYRVGETIWFKGYLFNGFSLSAYSKNLYAELINSEGTILQRKVYPIIESASAGSFDISDTWPAGSYTVRAYTTWMLNFDTAFIFQKTISLLTKDGATAAKSMISEGQTFSIQFFPEGGNLVNAVESVVAFKANDNHGMPVKVKGKIVDSKGVIVTSFSSMHDGMGSFSLLPIAGENYTAVWTDEKGKESKTGLPLAKEQGVVLKITSLGGKKVFQIARSEGVPDDWKRINIIALLGQERVYKAKANLENTTVTTGAIPVDQLPSGIMQITVFSEKWEPIVERIVMVNNENYYFTAKVNMPELNTNFRAKNTIEIQVDDTLLSNMSVSVTDAALGRQSSQDNIISRSLLTGDIKGYVHNPAYYFSNTSDTIASHLDLVMMTHGWRRYNWGMMSRGKKPVIKFPMEDYQSIEAKVFGVTTVSPLRPDEQLLVIILNKDSSRQFVEMNKSAIDKFYSPGVILFDTATLYYQFVKDKKAEKDLSLAFNNNFYKGVKRVDISNDFPVLIVDSSVLSRAKYFAEKNNQFNLGNVLETVVVKNTTKKKSRLEELDEKYARGMFRSSDAYIFDFTGEGNNYFLDIFSYLQGKVPGLQITGNGSNATLTWRGSKPLLYLNEIPSEVEMLSSVSASEVAYIKVLRPPFFGGIGGGAGGAIAVYTKKGDENKISTSGLGLSKTKLVGYSAKKEFYSPNYTDLSVSANVAADFRTTLYWNPFVLTDATRQKVRLEFFNNDVTKAYRIVLEGVNEIGKVIRIEQVVKQTK